ncbi:N-6 DNA methylase [Sphingomonas sp. YL-JM2C]
MEATAIAISNSVDRPRYEAREKRYLDIVGRYDRPVVDGFPKILAEIVDALETAPGDVLGAAFGELELLNAARGQFFTPYTVCQVMARVTLGTGENAKALIGRNGFVRALEPACGAGAMVIALAEAMRGQGINYQRHLHVTAVDIDPRAVHMAYIQLSLLHVPAMLIVGNSLSLETRETWFTPAHILGRWGQRLARRDADEAASAIRDPAAIPPPAAAPCTSTMSAPTATQGPDRPQPRQLSLF